MSKEHLNLDLDLELDIQVEKGENGYSFYLNGKLDNPTCPVYNTFQELKKGIKKSILNNFRHQLENELDEVIEEDTFEN